MLPLVSHQPNFRGVTHALLSASDIFVSNLCLTLCAVVCNEDAALVESPIHIHHVALQGGPT